MAIAGEVQKGGDARLVAHQFDEAAPADALEARIARLRTARDALGAVNLRADEDKRALEADPSIEVGALVHHETTTGLRNPVEAVGRVVRAVVVGVVGTAVLIGLAAGIGYAIFGVPDAVALGAVTTVVSLLPAGTVVMWVGAVIWLFFQNEIWNAVGMTIWGLVLVGTIDNFMRPILIRRSGSVHIPFLLILFGVLGGRWAFGLLGLLLGPVVLTVGFALIADLPGQREPTPDSAHADSSSDGTAS